MSAAELQAADGAAATRMRKPVRVAMMAVVGLLVIGAALSAGRMGEPLRARMQQRAAVELDENFAAGLDAWFGPRDWERHWNRERDGFVRVGELAIFRPSVQLSDYRCEFLARFGQKSIGWVFRASDPRNYYATRLLILKPGPPPQIALERWAVIQGTETHRVQVPIRMVLDAVRPIQIRAEVFGSSFRTSINDESVDFWSDPSLGTGGFGFIGQPADRCQIYWMRVRHQDDFWGKMCAQLVAAP